MKQTNAMGIYQYICHIRETRWRYIIKIRKWKEVEDYEADALRLDIT